MMLVPQFSCAIRKTALMTELLKQKRRVLHTQLELRMKATRHEVIIKKSDRNFKGSFAQKICEMEIVFLLLD